MRRYADRLIETNEDVSDVTVHIDPEDDELASPCDHLPLRNEILRRLGEQWQDLDFRTDIDKVVLHYLDGKVHVDVFLLQNGMSPEKSAELTAMICEGSDQGRGCRQGECVLSVLAAHHKWCV